ncbi:hypothetical protein [Anaerotignum sp.]
MERNKILCFSMTIVLSFGLLGCGSNAKKINEILGGSEFYYLDETEKIQPYYEMAEKRKEAILSSPTEIRKDDMFIPGETYTGNAYYISPYGNNDNDGLSPATAWQTAHRANWGDVQEGDAVFFERGGTYTIDTEPILAVSNVTYSAYGEGPKPIITLAQENSAQAKCWELYYDGKNGEKIWKYYQEVGEVCGVVFDDTSYAKRVLEWPTPDGWLALDIENMDPANGVWSSEDPCGLFKLNSAEEYRTVNEQLTDDLTYLCRVDLSGLSYPIDFGLDYRTGDLYLRCDDGNPGECFSDVAIIALQEDEWGNTYDSLIDGAHADGWVLDNLSLKHYGSSAVFSFVERGENAVIQNCTVEWGGNRLHIVQNEKPTTVYSLIGDSIFCLANNVTIRNNYMRQGGNAFTFEDNWETVDHLGTYSATGNLIENCGQGIRTHFIEDDKKEIFDELILRDNIIIDTGNSMNNACWEEPVAIDIGYGRVQYAKHIDISDNIMIGSTAAMLRIPNTSDVEIDFKNNVIVQSRDGALITECTDNIKWYMMEDVK